MCWSHCHRAYNKKLKEVVKNGDLRGRIDSDLQDIQWMVSSHEELGLVLDFVAAKHAEAARQSATDAEAVGAFFTYFFAQWGPESHVSR